MDTQQTGESQTARVMALGGLAAGVVGSLYVLLSERERESQPPRRLEVARQTLEDAAERARRQAQGVEAELAHTLQAARGTGEAKGRRAKKDARKASVRAQKDARKAGIRARKQTKREADEAREKVVSMVAGAKKKGSKRLQELEKQSPDVSTLAQQLLSRAEGSVGKAKESGSRSAAEARKNAEKAQSSLRDIVGRARGEAPKRLHDVEAKVAPKVRDLQGQAAGALDTGRGRAAELRERAEKDLLPLAAELRTRAEKDILPEVLGTADRVVKSVEEQAKGAATRLEHGSAEAAHKLAGATGAVETHAREAGSAVAEGGRDLRSLIVWLGLGGALVYAAFLNDEQRQKVQEYAKQVFGEASAMYGDIKGQNGTFGNA